jgi:hypothetical protein
MEALFLDKTMSKIEERIRRSSKEANFRFMKNFDEFNRYCWHCYMKVSDDDGFIYLSYEPYNNLITVYKRIEDNIIQCYKLFELRGVSTCPFELLKKIYNIEECDEEHQNQTLRVYYNEDNKGNDAEPELLLSYLLHKKIV